MRECIISFSSRKAGNCAQIGKFISEQLPNSKIYDFSDFEISSCGNCNYQCFNNADECPYVPDKEREIIEAIVNSTLTFFIVPNYCDFPCANFFIFNERSLSSFQKNEKLLSAYLKVPKKFIVVSNTNTDNFKTVFTYHCDTEPNILFLAAKKYGKTSINGDLLSSVCVVDELKKFIQ